jgi:putative phosphoesterase
MRIAVVSDTHSLLRPEVLPAIAGAEHILHAGDVEDIAILDALRTIAPVTAVRGNVDKHGPCAGLPAAEFVELGGTSIYMLHNIDELDLDPAAAGVQVVIYGHSHKAAMEKRSGVLYLNPGSIGPRRFNLPITFAWLTLNGGDPIAEIVTLPS